MSLLDSLVAYWKLNEDSGTRVDAFSTNNLADGGAAGARVGQIGHGASLTGTVTSILSIADNAALSMGDIDFSLACWVTLDTTTADRTLISKFTSGTNQREYILFYNQSANRFRFGVSETGTAITQSVDADYLGVPSTATRYFIVAWHDASANTINIQVNNGTVDSQSYSNGVFDGTAHFILGAYNFSSPAGRHDGLIDEVGVWKKALSAAERTALYNDVSGLYALGLTYPFNYEFNQDTNNPIITHNAYSWDTTRIAAPSFGEYDGSTWFMLMAGRDGSAYQGIGYATAPKSNPHNWTRNASLIISNGSGGDWDLEISSATGFYDSDETQWMIWYGDRGGGIGLATGASLASLSKDVGNPVFAGTGTDWEEYVRHPCVIKVGSTYHLFYDGRDDGSASAIGSVGHATSSDGINWTRDSGNNPILAPNTTEGWEDALIAHPEVMLIRGVYYLAYGAIGASSNQGWIGFARSLDSSTWTRVKNNPTISQGPGTTWGDAGMGMPGIYYEDGNIHIYHNGNDGSNVDIGKTTLDDSQFPAPTGLTATAINSTQINLAWTNNTTTEDNIKIYRSISANGDGFSLIDTISAGEDTYPDSGLSPETTYYYFVEAIEGDAASFNSNIDDDTTPISAQPRPSVSVPDIGGLITV